VTIAAWSYTIHSAGSMSSGMPMPGGWTMSMAWMSMGGQSRLAHAAMFVTMWTVMMVAMMLPSVMPAVLLHRRLIRSRVQRGDAAAGSHLILLAGYFLVWSLFGLTVYAIGMAVSAAAMRHPGVRLLVPVATGATLIAAGLYQLTRWKQVCLRHCRSPLEFFSRHQIRTPGHSLVFGLHHGAYCAACCWGLMAIQVSLGIMHVPLMLLVALVILLEKQWRHGEALAAFAGVAAIAGGVFLVVRATIRA
jgi:predicted metal-binding membrane protein